MFGDGQNRQQPSPTQRKLGPFVGSLSHPRGMTSGADVDTSRFRQSETATTGGFLGQTYGVLSPKNHSPIAISVVSESFHRFGP